MNVILLITWLCVYPITIGIMKTIEAKRKGTYGELLTQGQKKKQINKINVWWIWLYFGVAVIIYFSNVKS